MTTGLKLFDNTLQKTSSWLDEVMFEMGTESRRRAYTALRAVSRDEFIAAVENRLQFRDIDFDMWGYDMAETWPETDTEAIVRAVFRVLSRKVTEGEIRDIKNTLPRDIRDMWPI